MLKLRVVKRGGGGGALRHEVPGVVAVLCECMGGFGLGNLP